MQNAVLGNHGQYIEKLKVSNHSVYEQQQLGGTNHQEMPFVKLEFKTKKKLYTKQHSTAAARFNEFRIAFY